MTVVDKPALSHASVVEAAARIAPHVRRTPTERSPALSQLAGREVYLKLEKPAAHRRVQDPRRAERAHAPRRREARRGCRHRVRGQPRSRRGVRRAAHRRAGDRRAAAWRSAREAHGDPAQRRRDRFSQTAATTKRTPVALEIARTRGRTYVHAFDDDEVIAGQGTVALELLEDADEIDTLVVPVGGGGLIAGIALAASERKPRLRIIGVQSQSASAFAASFRAGHVVERPAATIADGISVAASRGPHARDRSQVRRRHHHRQR